MLRASTRMVPAGAALPCASLPASSHALCQLPRSLQPKSPGTTARPIEVLHDAVVDAHGGERREDAVEGLALGVAARGPAPAMATTPSCERGLVGAEGGHHVARAEEEHARVPEVPAACDERLGAREVGLLDEAADGGAGVRPAGRGVELDVAVAGLGALGPDADGGDGAASRRRRRRRERTTWKRATSTMWWSLGRTMSTASGSVRKTRAAAQAMHGAVLRGTGSTRRFAAGSWSRIAAVEAARWRPLATRTRSMRSGPTRGRMRSTVSRRRGLSPSEREELLGAVRA